MLACSSAAGGNRATAVRAGQSEPRSVPTARRNCGPASLRQVAMTSSACGQLALGDVEAPGGQRRPQLHEQRPEVDLDGERVVGPGARHDRDHGDAQEIGGAEPVQERLQQARVAGLVGGRGHDDQRARTDPLHGLFHAGRGPVEELRTEVGEVHRQPVAPVEPGFFGRGRRRPPPRSGASATAPWGSRRRRRPRSRRCGAERATAMPAGAAITRTTR